ncbi:hypothetical protein KR044_004989, partial [Drosophila immigrans]
MAYRGIIGTKDGKNPRETDSDSFDDILTEPSTEATVAASRRNKVSSLESFEKSTTPAMKLMKSPNRLSSTA